MSAQWFVSRNIRGAWRPAMQWKTGVKPWYRPEVFPRGGSHWRSRSSWTIRFISRPARRYRFWHETIWSGAESCCWDELQPAWQSCFSASFRCSGGHFFLHANIVKPVALCQSQKMSEGIQKKSIRTCTLTHWFFCNFMILFYLLIRSVLGKILSSFSSITW